MLIPMLTFQPVTWTPRFVTSTNIALNPEVFALLLILECKDGQRRDVLKGLNMQRLHGLILICFYTR